MSAQQNWPVAIIGSGNIGTDLMIKILRSGGPLRAAAMVDINPDSDGLVCADRMGVPTTAHGIDGLLAMPEFEDIKIVFDAGSADAHRTNWAKLEPTGVRVLGLTPTALGPFCVPVVNVDAHLEAPNVNMVTCGGQATVPIVAAVSHTSLVSYAEVISSISAKSAGPGTRAGIDECVETTAAAIETVGGAQRGKAIMILSSAEPPIPMRNTVYCLVDGDADHRAIERSIVETVAKVNRYVPGYRLKRGIQFETFSQHKPLHIPETGEFTGTRLTAMLEVTSAAHHLPAYAGNVDIMTSAALATAERIATQTAGAAT